MIAEEVEEDDSYELKSSVMQYHSSSSFPKHIRQRHAFETNSMTYMYE